MIHGYANPYLILKKGRRLVNGKIRKKRGKNQWDGNTWNKESDGGKFRLGEWEVGRCGGGGLRDKLIKRCERFIAFASNNTQYSSGKTQKTKASTGSFWWPPHLKSITPTQLFLFSFPFFSILFLFLAVPTFTFTQFRALWFKKLLGFLI